MVILSLNEALLQTLAASALETVSNLVVVEVDLRELAKLGLGSGLGSSLAEVSRVSVFEYVILPASALWGYLLWSETLGWSAWIGMGLIALAGIVIARPQPDQSPIASRQ